MTCLTCRTRDATAPWQTCLPCASRTGHALAELPGLVADAAQAAVEPLRAPRSGPRVGGSTEPPTPLLADAADLSAGARAGSIAVADRSAWPGDQIGHLSVATELDFWVRDIASCRNEGTPLPNVTDLCGWLGDRLDWTVEHYPPVDEMLPKIWALRGTLRAVLGLTTPRPAVLPAPCRTCDLVALWRDPDSGYIACAACDALLTESEYAEWCRHLANQP